MDGWTPGCQLSARQDPAVFIVCKVYTNSIHLLSSGIRSGRTDESQRYVKKLSKAEWAGVPERIHMLEVSGTI